MTTKHDILDEVFGDYEEWIEVAGQDAPIIIIEILCVLVCKERDKNKQLQERITNERFNRA